MELASPKKMVGNAVVLAAIPVIIIFVSPITVEMVTDQAIDNPLITAVVVLIAILLILFGKSTSRMGGGAPPSP